MILSHCEVVFTSHIMLFVWPRAANAVLLSADSAVWRMRLRSSGDVCAVEVMRPTRPHPATADGCGDAS